MIVLCNALIVLNKYCLNKEEQAENTIMPQDFPKQKYTCKFYDRN